MQLYEDFAKSRAKKDLDSTVGSVMKLGLNEKKQSSSHIFQVVPYALFIVLDRTVQF